MAKRANQGVVSHATSNSSISALIDTARGRGKENRADYWIDSILKITAGTASGSEVTVTAFTPATGLISFTPAVASAIAASTVYELHKIFSPTEVKDAINDAIAQAYPAWFSYVRDSTSITTSSALEYTLPTTIEDLLNVEIETVSTSAPMKLSTWSHDKANGKVVLGTMPLAGKKLYVEGIGRPSALTNDTDTTPVHPQFIYKVATIELQLKQIWDSPSRDLQREKDIVNLLGSAVPMYRKVYGYNPPPSSAF